MHSSHGAVSPSIYIVASDGTRFAIPEQAAALSSLLKGALEMWNREHAPPPEEDSEDASDSSFDHDSDATADTYEGETTPDRLDDDAATYASSQTATHTEGPEDRGLFLPAGGPPASSAGGATGRSGSNGSANHGGGGGGLNRMRRMVSVEAVGREDDDDEDATPSDEEAPLETAATGPATHLASSASPDDATAVGSGDEVSSDRTASVLDVDSRGPSNASSHGSPSPQKGVNPQSGGQGGAPARAGPLFGAAPENNTRGNDDEEGEDDRAGASATAADACQLAAEMRALQQQQLSEKVSRSPSNSGGSQPRTPQVIDRDTATPSTLDEDDDDDDERGLGNDDGDGDGDGDGPSPSGTADTHNIHRAALQTNGRPGADSASAGTSSLAGDSPSSSSTPSSRGHSNTNCDNDNDNDNDDDDDTTPEDLPLEPGAAAEGGSLTAVVAAKAKGGKGTKRVSRKVKEKTNGIRKATGKDASPKNTLEPADGSGGLGAAAKGETHIDPRKTVDSHNHSHNRNNSGGGSPPLSPTTKGVLAANGSGSSSGSATVVVVVAADEAIDDDDDDDDGLLEAAVAAAHAGVENSSHHIHSGALLSSSAVEASPEWVSPASVHQRTPVMLGDDDEVILVGGDGQEETLTNFGRQNSPPPTVPQLPSPSSAPRAATLSASRSHPNPNNSNSRANRSDGDSGAAESASVFGELRGARITATEILIDLRTSSHDSNGTAAADAPSSALSAATGGGGGPNPNTSSGHPSTTTASNGTAPSAPSPSGSTLKATAATTHICVNYLLHFARANMDLDATTNDSYNNTVASTTAGSENSVNIGGANGHPAPQGKSSGGGAAGVGGGPSDDDGHPAILQSPLPRPLISQLSPWEQHFLYIAVLGYDESILDSLFKVFNQCPHMDYRSPGTCLKDDRVRKLLLVPPPPASGMQTLHLVMAAAKELRVDSLYALCCAWMADHMIRICYGAADNFEAAHLIRQSFHVQSEWSRKETDCLKVENEWPANEEEC